MVLSDDYEAGNLLASDSHNLAVIMLLANHTELYAAERARVEATLAAAAAASADAANTAAAAPGLKRGGRQRRGAHQAPIFCEILDTRTQQLVADHPTLGDACHFLVSNRLISKIMAMVSEDRNVAAILTDLLGPDMALGLKPSRTYAAPDESVSFYAIMKRAQRLNHVSARRRNGLLRSISLFSAARLCGLLRTPLQIILGYQKRDDIREMAINPKDKAVPKVWGAYDFITIVRVRFRCFAVSLHKLTRDPRDPLWSVARGNTRRSSARPTPMRPLAPKRGLRF